MNDETLVRDYGPLWARNSKNLRKLDQRARKLSGVYLLYLGWFPVYIGKGKLFRRISGHLGSHTKVWDRFTWFALTDPSRCAELEAILLRSLPFYLRLNNKQGAHLPIHSTKEDDNSPIPISLPKMTPKKRPKKKHR